MSFPVPVSAVLTGAAGLVHASAAVTHVGESMSMGLLFAATGWAQMITAVWVAASRSRAAVVALSLTNIAAVAGWIASRTVGLPVVHPAVEAVGTADVITVALEVLALAAVLVQVLRSGDGRRAGSLLPLGAVAAGVFALGASGVAVASLGTGSGHGHDEQVSAAGSDDHGHEESDAHPPEGSAEAGLSRQPGTLPAALHRHRPGIYHLHEDIELHHHDKGLVHVHTASSTSPSPSPAPSDPAHESDSGDHHDDTGSHPHG